MTDDNNLENKISTYEFNSKTLSKDEMMAFIGKNSSKFENIIEPTIARYNGVPVKYKRVMFINWWAILTSYGWFFYRKMYVVGVLFFVTVMYLSSLIDKSGSSQFAAMLPALMGNFIYSEYCAFYIRRLKKKLVKKNKIPISENDFLQLLAKKGGISWTSGIVSFVIILSIALLGMYATEVSKQLDSQTTVTAPTGTPSEQIQ